MSKLREILEKLSYTRHSNSESADKQTDQAEKQILETHIPKSQLPSKKEIFKLIFDWDGKDDGELATAIRGLYENRTKK